MLDSLDQMEADLNSAADSIDARLKRDAETIADLNRRNDELKRESAMTALRNDRLERLLVTAIALRSHVRDAMSPRHWRTLPEPVFSVPSGLLLDVCEATEQL